MCYINSWTFLTIFSWDCLPSVDPLAYDNADATFDFHEDDYVSDNFTHLENIEKHFSSPPFVNESNRVGGKSKSVGNVNVWMLQNHRVSFICVG